MAKIPTRLYYLTHSVLHILSDAIAKVIGHVLESKMEKNTVDFFLSSGLPLTPHFNVVDVKAATRWT